MSVTNDNVNECNGCPPGYTFNDKTGFCEIEETSPATYSGSLFTINKGPTSSAYGWGGLKLYPDITSMQLPIQGNGITNAVYQLQDQGGTVLNPISTANGIQSALWGSQNGACSPVASGEGKLNTVGIWSNSYPTNTELCFEFCVNVDGGNAIEKTIGVAGDNEVRLYVDGQLIVDLSAPGAGVTRPFNYWYVFPYTFSPGNHIIKLCGVDFGFPGTFGAEVYDRTGAQIAADFAVPLDTSVSPTDCGNVPGDLAPYVLFSTENMINAQIPDPRTPGQWTCPDDTYSLTACNGTYECTRSVTANTLGCCYTVKDCESQVEHDIIINPLCDTTLPAINVNIGEVWKFTLDPTADCENPPLNAEKCYEIINFKNPCQNEVPLCSYCPGERLANCDSCKPCYVCTNCTDETDKIYFKWDPNAGNQPDFTKTWTFAFEPTKCWTCEVIDEPCLPPNVKSVIKSICSGDKFIINDYLIELVQNSGTYTYEFYVDPTHDTLWTESLNGWQPTNLPNGYAGPVLTLYVLIYEEGCSIPGEAVLQLEWESLETCHECTPPALIPFDTFECDCPVTGQGLYDLVAIEQTLALSSHPEFANFTYTWYSDSSLSIPVPNPSAAVLNSGVNSFYLKVEYFGCQQTWSSNTLVTVELLPRDHPSCLSLCGGA